jgi:hypothetical protein
LTTPINLNRARKDKARQTAKAEAATNRAKHGQTKLERIKAAKQAEAAKRALDGAKRE